MWFSGSVFPPNTERQTNLVPWVTGFASASSEYEVLTMSIILEIVQLFSLIVTAAILVNVKSVKNTIPR